MYSITMYFWFRKRSILLPSPHWLMLVCLEVGHTPLFTHGWENQFSWSLPIVPSSGMVIYTWVCSDQWLCNPPNDQPMKTAQGVSPQIITQLPIHGDTQSPAGCTRSSAKLPQPPPDVDPQWWCTEMGEKKQENISSIIILIFLLLAVVAVVQ